MEDIGPVCRRQLDQTTVTREPSGLITAPSMYPVASRTSADCRRSSRLLLRLPPCPRRADRFPAMEAPAQLAADLQAFFGPLR